MTSIHIHSPKLETFQNNSYFKNIIAEILSNIKEATYIIKKLRPA